MTVRIINTEKPDQFIEIESFGRGLDPGDKGFEKASTYAHKYALLNAYKIATGEDPDLEKSKEQKIIEPNVKKDAVVNYMMSDNNYLQNVLSYFNIGSIDDMNDNQINTVFNNL